MLRVLKHRYISENSGHHACKRDILVIGERRQDDAKCPKL